MNGRQDVSCRRHLNTKPKKKHKIVSSSNRNSQASKLKTLYRKVQNESYKPSQKCISMIITL